MREMDMFQREGLGIQYKSGWGEEQTVVGSFAAHTPAPGSHRGAPTQRVYTFLTGCLIEMTTGFPYSKEETAPFLSLWFARGPPREDEDYTRCEQSQVRRKGKFDLP
jgi:hypothetical protein